jgi:hypothetical protein
MRLNTVTISRSYYAPDKRRDAFAAGPFNWLSRARPETAPGAPPLLVKIRHGPNTAACALRLGDAGGVAAWVEAAAAAGGGGGGDSAGALMEAQAAAASELSQVAARGRASAAAAEASQAASQAAAAPGEEYGLVVLEERDQGIAAGQYAVFYQGGACLGSAKILGAVGGREALDALRGAAGGGG